MGLVAGDSDGRAQIVRTTGGEHISMSDERFTILTEAKLTAGDILAETYGDGNAFFTIPEREVIAFMESVAEQVADVVLEEVVRVAGEMMSERGIGRQGREVLARLRAILDEGSWDE